MPKEFELKHPSGLLISKNLKVSDLSRDMYSKSRGMGNGYVWYTLTESQISGKTVIFDLCFLNGKIYSINFCLSDDKLYGSSWDDWSEGKEMIRADDTISWVKAIGYMPGKYSWGEIWAGLDRKEGLGGGGVRYHH